MWNRSRMICNSIYNVFQSPFFGFIEGHSYLEKGHLISIKNLIGKKDDEVVREFEKSFAELIGEGQAISYAAARMGFYDLMCLRGIGKGHEVILLGATCSVMSTAVIRTGATPIYSDIDPETLGSSGRSIKSCISKKTRMIVAQHSFGIPCDIDSIVKIAQNKNIFLLEDCAITLGSKVNDRVVGNFGNAALFSFDHSKPINTMIGGIIYTKDKKLAALIGRSRDSYKELGLKKQYSIWRRLIIEKWFCNSKHYGKMKLVDVFYSAGKKIFRITEPFLLDEFKSELTNTEVSYPAKMPPFLAQLGVYEINRWNSNINAKKNILNSFINLVDNTNVKKFLPNAYKNNSLNIIPSRFVWSEPYGKDRRDKLSDVISVDWIWFLKPIISTSLPLEDLGYINGSCPDSEKITQGMVNIPCNISERDQEYLFKKLNSVLSP
jgi:perosamine synthetase